LLLLIKSRVFALAAILAAGEVVVNSRLLTELIRDRMVGEMD